MLLRLPYLALTSVFTFIRLLPMSDTDKDIEILTLCHQLAVLQRQAGKPRLTRADRTILAALLHRLPRARLRRLHLIVAPDTILRWHRDLPRRRHAEVSRRKHPRPAADPPRHPVPRPTPGPGEHQLGLPSHPRELTMLGIKVAPSTVWEILKQHGIQPAPQRDRQTARNLVMDLHDAGATVKHPIRDHDNKFTRAFDAAFESEGIGIVTTGIRVPRMNSIMERCSAPLRPVPEPLTEPSSTSADETGSAAYSTNTNMPHNLAPT